MGTHEHFGQNDARIRQALDYDDSGGAPSSTRAGVLWVPSSGKWAPRDVLLASDYGVANGVAELDSSGLLPATRLPASAVTTTQRGPIGGVQAQTLAAGTYSLDATSALVRRFTLTGDITLNVPTSGVDGQRITFWFGASGATRLVTFASGYEVSPLLPSRTVSIASGTWELIDIECRNGTWRLARTDQLLFAPGDIGAAAAGHTHSTVIFQGRANATQTLAVSGTSYPIALGAEDYDTDNAHSTSTNTSRFTAARAGTYQVDGVVPFPAGSGLRNVNIGKNGTVVPGSFNQIPASSTSLNLADTKQVFVELAVGDYLELYAAQTQGSNIATTYQSSTPFATAMLRVRSLFLY